MSDKTEWPTEDHLAGLRTQGVVPIIKLTVVSFSSLCLLLCIYSLHKDFAQLIASVSKSQHELDLQGLLTAVKSKMLPILVLPIFAMLSGGLLIGLLQSKFLFRPEAISLDFGRLQPFKLRHGLGFGQRMALFALVLLVNLTLLPALLYLSTFYSFKLFLIDQQSLGSVVANAWPAAFLVVLVFLAIVTVASWLIGRFFFMLRHRMSREERSREGRQDSISRV